MSTKNSDEAAVPRRRFLATAAATATLAGGVGPHVGCASPEAGTKAAVAPPHAPVAPKTSTPMKPPTFTIETLTFPWVTQDPFLFCAYHLDSYPKGNDVMGPAKDLSGRRLGMDFSRRDGWSMYHGQQVPGFPRHPHRGFETVTVTRTGVVDHTDSLGATARYGAGDAQWMTAGKGIVHSEMFPLVQRDSDNPLELFQVWLNLPAKNKMVEPHFTMLWHEAIPIHRFVDTAGKSTTVRTIAGTLDGKAPPTPPPNSWAADPSAQVAIWTIDLEPGGQWTLPAVGPGLSRVLYFFRGDSLLVAGKEVPEGRRMVLGESDRALSLQAGAKPAQLLLLQGRPIGEPVAHRGPFVMNTQAELHQAVRDYQRNQFGGWRWPSDAPVHAREQGRFALHVDGRRDTPS